MSLGRINRIARQIQSVLQPVIVAALVLVSATAVIATGMAFAGRLPWPEIQIGYGGQALEIGMYVQIGLTALLIMLGIYLPTTWRVQRLELSHRRFEIGMADVTRAYAVAHAGDRAGTFNLKGEFDSVRERFQFLRDHPDLGDMEPGILEIAAQMSHVSAELAHTYSDEKVERARAFLRQRHEELAQFDARIEEATAITNEIVHWSRCLELEEAVAKSKLQRLKEELREVLPAVLPPAARTTEVQRRLTELSEKAAANRHPAE
ncbi:DNA repair protein [Pseudooceanicola sp. MF1-13]|uniref:DNA repair protein n=1 Tax=Pseudooceanicola sp. MF1-13 TaxID=3379095 RepID=UPI003891A66A